MPIRDCVGRFGTRGLWVIGALIVAAVVVVSASALVFQGRDDGHRRAPRPRPRAAHRAGDVLDVHDDHDHHHVDDHDHDDRRRRHPRPRRPRPRPRRSRSIPPPPPPAPAPACDGAGSSVINAMNGDRVAAGLGQLCANAQLNGFAQSWANWMAQNQSLTHQDLGAVLAGTTFNTVAENILAGAGEHVARRRWKRRGWQSPRHRENILNGAYRAAGVGIAYSSDGQVWVAVEFGG